MKKRKLMTKDGINLKKDCYYINSTSKVVIKRLEKIGIKHWGEDDEDLVCIEVILGEEYRVVNHDPGITAPLVSRLGFMELTK